MFIGNIPYGPFHPIPHALQFNLHTPGVSEEQICEIFGRIGNVLNFRLVYDKETGRPKGFGFLEYSSMDEAASAVRNLNEHEIMGRTLRVDYSNDNGGSGRTQGPTQDQDSNRAPPPAHFNVNMTVPAPQSNGELPALPPGVELPNGLTAPDAISRTLSQIPAPNLLDIISQMKNLAANDPAQATQLLQQAPQLSYAVFQALVLLGLVDQNVVGSLIQQIPQQQPAPAPQPSQPLSMPFAQPAYPPPPQPYPYQQTQPPYTATPPVQHVAYAPPPQQPAPAATAPDQAALIQQVMGMSRDQIWALDPSSRDQIIALRAQLGVPVQ